MTVLITGATRGIGAALHDLYARQDAAEVIGTYRGHAPKEGRWIALDVTNPDDQIQMARALDGEAVDLLVCNAGVYLDKGMKLADDYGAEVWADTFAANVTGVFLTVQALLPQLQMAETAKIAVIASQMGSTSRASGGSYAYRASKAAAINLGRNLAADLQEIGIAVGIYHPGWVRTDMGGGKAHLSEADSARGLKARFDELDLDGTGACLNWDGSRLEI